MPVTEVPGPVSARASRPSSGRTYVLDHLSARVGRARVRRDPDHTAQRVVHVPQVTSDGSAGWYGELEEIDAATRPATSWC